MERRNVLFLLLLACYQWGSSTAVKDGKKTEQKQEVSDIMPVARGTGRRTEWRRECNQSRDCLPWTKCTSNTHGSTCVCKNQEEMKRHNRISCHQETLSLLVSQCSCVTFNEVTKELEMGFCSMNCVKYNPQQGQWLALPHNISKLNHFMCEKRWNRTGRLCGKCLPGHSPLAYSYDLRCVKCPKGNKNVWKYILVAFGPLTIFFFLVLFLKVNALSSQLHGYIIFSQLISAPAFLRIALLYAHHYYNKNMKITIQTVGTLYGVWNLDFFRMLDLDICLDVSSLTVLALDYAVAIYPLLLTVLSYFLIELHTRNVRIVVILWKPFRSLFTLLRREWNIKTTIIDAYVTFIVLSFMKILSVSTDLLIPVGAYTLTNDSVTWVLYYDATVDYFGREHLPYAFLAITCLTLTFVLIILLLLFYQLKCFQKLLDRLRIHNHFLSAVMDSFQGCYKNGTESGTRDYRWFAAVPFIGELAILVIHVYTLDTTFFLLAVTIITCLMAFIAAIQPYKRHLSKFAKIDIVFWGFLAIIYTLIAIIGYSGLYSTRLCPILLITMTIIPLIYLVCSAAYWMLSKMKRVKALASQIKAWKRGYVNMATDSEALLPDRLLNPENYEQRRLLKLENPTGES